MHSNNYTLGFVFIVTIVLGIMLSFTKMNIKDLQEENLQADVKKNILRSLDFEEKENEPWSNNQVVERMFKENIKALCVNTNGDIVDCKKDDEIIHISEIDIEKNIESLPVYLKIVDKKIEGIAIPIAGKGLWSTIYGYIALYPDTDRILGIQFYKHGETPGLGGEVEKEWFTRNFTNHPIKDSNGKIIKDEDGKIDGIPKKIRNNNGDIIGIDVLKGAVQYSSTSKQVDFLDTNPLAIHQVDGISGATVTAKGLDSFLKEDLKKYEAYLNKVRDSGTI